MRALQLADGRRLDARARIPRRPAHLRPLLIDCLQQSLPRDAVVYKTVSEVIAHPGRKPVVRFADGSPDESADLVVGADGIRSIVRRDLFGNGEESRPQYS